MIQAAIFDMDGLLINSEPFWRQAEMEVFREVGIDLSEDDCRETMGYRLNEVVDLWYSRQPWGNLKKSEVEKMIVERVAELIGRNGELLPGVQKTLERCADSDLKIAMASSSPIFLIEKVVDRFNLSELFDILHSAQWERFGKPHPDVFINTAAKLEVRSESCIVFEDSFHGMIAALAAKMKVVTVPEKIESKFNASHLTLPELDPDAVFSFFHID